MVCYDYGMGDISLEMIWKRLEDLQADIRAVRDELAILNETVRSLARSNVTIQRDLKTLKDHVNILSAAVDEHPPTHA